MANLIFAIIMYEMLVHFYVHCQAKKQKDGVFY